jgi:pyridoxamine 5'-phosphate oxidase
MSDFTELLPDPLPTEPLAVIQRWLAESWKLRAQPNPNAMVLATVAADGQPSARVVLCKDIVPQPGYIVFYTNYLSKKGRQLTEQPRAAAVFHWDAMHRQVRIEGPAVTSPAAESDRYFASRPWQSRLGAWASAQSEPVGSRKELQSALAKAAERFGTPSPTTASSGAPKDYPVPRPPHWGGFRLWADSVELWVEGDARIHDRARWTRKLTQRAATQGGDMSIDAGSWTVTRLQP